MSGKLIHASEEKTAEMMYIASHPTNPWLAPELYDYPKSSVEEYATTHTSVKALSLGGTSGYTVPAYSTPLSTPTPEPVYDAQDSLIKHLASLVKVEE